MGCRPLNMVPSKDEEKTLTAESGLDSETATEFEGFTPADA